MRRPQSWHLLQQLSRLEDDCGYIVLLGFSPGEIARVPA